MSRTIFDRTFTELKGISSVDDNLNADTTAKGTLKIKAMVSHYLNVSSSHRNTTTYPLHYKYRLNLANEYRNVTRVTLINITVPNSTGILDEPILALSIDELNDTKTQTSNNTIDVFSVFPIKTPEKPTGGFINYSPNILVSREFAQPIKLTSLNVSILDLEGIPFDFGAPSGSTSKTLQHKFLLKIDVSAMQ